MPNNYNLHQAAVLLGVDAPTLRQRAHRMRQRGLRVGTLDGRRWRYTQADLRRLRAAGREKDNA